MAKKRGEWERYDGWQLGVKRPKVSRVLRLEDSADAILEIIAKEHAATISDVLRMAVSEEITRFLKYLRQDGRVIVLTENPETGKLEASIQYAGDPLEGGGPKWILSA